MVEQHGRATVAAAAPRRGSWEFAAGLEKEELQGKRVLLRRGAKRYSIVAILHSFYVGASRRCRRVVEGKGALIKVQWVSIYDDR
jgi:hypothetical protein